MIYTAICGKIDPPRNDVECFTGNYGFTSDRMNAKIYKVLAHLFFTDDNVWVDGNIYPRKPEAELVEQLLGEHDIAAFKHPFRKDAMAEYNEIKVLKHPYRGMGWYLEKATQKPLVECGVLLRRNNERVRRLNEIWWSLICRFTERDQVSFPCAAAMVPGLKLRVIDANLRECEWFEYRPRGEAKPSCDSPAEGVKKESV